MKAIIALYLSLLLSFPAFARENPVASPYPTWRHTGEIAILTTPEGADLPAGAVVEDFPLLLRLNKDWFDFKQAEQSGRDVRFATKNGVPLAYPMNEWVHLVHTFGGGPQRIYINGKLDGEATTKLDIKSPSRLWIGGWYNNYDFIGDIDEVLISKVARSADWVKLQYENQKPLQTLVGPVVRTGDAFSVSPGKATIAESNSATFTARADGALKLYWLLKRDGKETLVAVDRHTFTFDAGRVLGNQTVTLQCKAIYPNEVRTREIAITIQDTIPDSVFLKVYAHDKSYKKATAKPAADKSHSLFEKLKPGLIEYKVEFGTTVGGKDAILETVNNIVCGDAYLIDGQSNALATDTHEESPPETHEWIRSYGNPPRNAKDTASNLWYHPVWKARKGEKAELSWWGMELAKRLVDSQRVPVCIINAAVGGTRIDQHQRNAEDPTDLSTIYGRMLRRARQAKLTHGIRGIMWHQGENDQGSAGPSGGYGWETDQPLFVEMSAGWKQDFPNVRHYYVFQIWPNSCSMGGSKGSGDRLREKQRTLPRLYSNMSIMSTLGVSPPGSCHFPLAGWSEFARLIQPLIERDHYGKEAAISINPPNLMQASFANPRQDAITLEFDQPVVWTDALSGKFYLDGKKGRIASGSASGKVLTLQMKEAATAKRITHLKETNWSQDTLCKGVNGIAALTFYEVPGLPT